VRSRFIIAFSAVALGAFSAVAIAQQQTPESPPQVRINYLNVCTPGEPEQKELAAALKDPASKPAFAPDFEVARGITTTQEGSRSRWVRIRREFPTGTFSTVQYTFSVDEKAIVETLVFRAREAKNVVQLSRTA
jgi:hypothetical protein